MTPIRRANLLRLLNPRHIAVVGGRDAEVVAGECKRIGYAGPFWPVNPKREKIGGFTCFPSVDDLPEAPDAVFLAIPREATIETLAKLNAMGAGGGVCYTAGFAETGDEGRQSEDDLIEAAGDLALIGPNCYGMINYVNRAALWPFAHGGSFPGYGAAIITQSGMLSSDLTMSQRSVPFAYMISAGNQAVLQLEDFVDVLCERDEVKAIGLHIEGLKDISGFERAALKALERNVPIVALKSGTSHIGAELTVSHTGSLSGSEELHDALFYRLGVIRVDNPAQLLETLKFLCVAGSPRGARLAGFTCSGGGATMLADHAEKIGLTYPKPLAETSDRLRSLLPHTATVSNPLDYTTPIWGQRDRTEPVFQTFLQDGHDAAVLIQDYPAPGLDEGRIFYFNDAQGFVAATKAADIPAAICSTLPENLDRETRDYLVSNRVAPMQGLPECLTAIASAAWYGNRRRVLLATPNPERRPAGAAPDAAALIDEAEAKALIAQAGVAVPSGCIVSSADISNAGGTVYPVAVKMLNSRLPHKTEAGAVRLSVSNPRELRQALTDMRRTVSTYDKNAVTDRFLVESMVESPIAELLVSVRRDPQFGYAMTLASGGILTELVGDAATILLPAHRQDIETALGRLRVLRLIDGFRGAGVDRAPILDALEQLADLVLSQNGGIAELEINPLFVTRQRVVAVDALMRVSDLTASQTDSPSARRMC